MWSTYMSTDERPSTAPASSDDQDDEYEVIDYSDHPIYCILSTLLQDNDGNNVCDHLRQLTDAVAENTRVTRALLEHLVVKQVGNQPATVGNQPATVGNQPASTVPAKE